MHLGHTIGTILLLIGVRICVMLDDSLDKAATGLAVIIPAILFLRWFLGRKVGSPDEWLEEQIKELERRFALGEIDEETYHQRLRDMRDS